MDLYCKMCYIWYMKKITKLVLKHDKPFQIRMSEELINLVHGAANLAGLSYSGWARAKLVEAARAEYKKAGKAPPDKDK